MPAAIKRRKVSTATAKNPTSSGPRGLDAFTRVSKSNSTGKEVIAKCNLVDSKSTALWEPNSTNERKRKSEEDAESAEHHPLPTIHSRTQNRNIKPLPQRRPSNSRSNPQTPQNPISTIRISGSAETPTKGARSLLDQLFLSSKTSSPSSQSRNEALVEQSDSQTLPAELLDLVDLHAAFLTTLSLHYAHNGTHAPADLRNICPDVARAWGKRAVTLNDIRRTLGVMNTNIPEGSNMHKISQLSLSDYGHGKVCVEIVTGPGRLGRIARPVDENLLNEIYVRGLQKAWGKRSAEGLNLQEFIESLPLESITLCSSLIKMSPLLAKGQQRLEDLRSGLMVRKDAAKARFPGTENSKELKPTLLDRLRAKQMQQSSYPPPLSKAELGRKAALQRIEEVAAVLSILSTSSSVGQQRISFTMPTVLGKLRDSFKSPLSKEEGDVCIRLLASDIAPEWVRLIKIGKVEALVVNREGRPSESDFKRRVRRAT